MFAIAVADVQKKELILARDPRIGKVPGLRSKSPRKSPRRAR